MKGQGVIMHPFLQQLTDEKGKSRTIMTIFDTEEWMKIRAGKFFTSFSRTDL